MHVRATSTTGGILKAAPRDDLLDINKLISSPQTSSHQVQVPVFYPTRPENSQACQSEERAEAEKRPYTTWKEEKSHGPAAGPINGRSDCLVYLVIPSLCVKQRTLIYAY